MHFDENTKNEILEKANLEETISSFVSLKKSGSNLIGDCPNCGQKKLNYVPKKDFYKCFSCDKGGNAAASFLMEMQGQTYPQALEWLANKFNVYIENKPFEPKVKNKAARNKSFRDLQLEQSGISNIQQRQAITNHNAQGEKYEIDRYEAASVDKYFGVIPGDDMVLHYIDLDGELMTYFPPRKTKPVPLRRVRYQFPEAHKDKNGKSVKYRSPYGSGSALWIPSVFLAWYMATKKELFKEGPAAKIYETLYITEGEKKADKMCACGLPTVGLMGIHNLSINGEMPIQIQQIVKTMGFSNVVFVLDADWEKITAKEDENVSARLNVFYRAVTKFRDYFYALNNSKISLEIFFAYHLAEKEDEKGMDDFLMGSYKKKQDKLAENFSKALVAADGKYDSFQAHKITTINEFKIKELFSLNNTQDFFKKYKKELVKLSHFKMGKILYKTTADGSFEMAMPIMPHEKFWIEKETKNGSVYQFDYHNINVFLRNRGFGIFKTQTTDWRFIYEDGRKIEEVDHLDIREFIKDFMHDLGNLDVIRMMNKGVEQYIGPSKLHNMFQRTPQVIQPKPNVQYLYFKNKVWAITAEKIEEIDYMDLPGYVWKNNIMQDHSPELMKEPIFEVINENEHDDRLPVKWKINETAALKKSEWYKYIFNTSNFYWRKFQKEIQLPDGRTAYEPKDEIEMQSNRITKTEVQEIKNAVTTKILATGYIFSEYRDLANMKAVVATDSVESEVGQSKGRTGKSVFTNQFAESLKVEIIDGKRPKLTEDKFIYENVDERTKAIIFDDCRVNLDFENFFSQITSGITINPKGLKSFKLPAPKFIFSTNHAINGNDDSTIARQFNVVFSDYYNPSRSPNDEFGHLLFKEWDNDQWNYYFNFLAASIQTFLKYPNLSKYGVQSEALVKRNLRQQMGEAFLDWAIVVLSEEGKYLNRMVQKEILYEEFLAMAPTQRKYTTTPVFKNKLKAFCEYQGLLFNPIPFGKDRNNEHENGGRYTSNGVEYYIVTTKDFVAEEVRRDRLTTDNKAE